jgi:hypothetical protein
LGSYTHGFFFLTFGGGNRSSSFNGHCVEKKSPMGLTKMQVMNLPYLGPDGIEKPVVTRIKSPMGPVVGQTPQPIFKVSPAGIYLRQG